jgi:hypothetical protein
MANESYIMVCDQDRVYTALHEYNRKTGAFSGEYSLLHNAYSGDDYFLARFLLQHEGHALRLLSSAREEYLDILHTYGHFMYDDISKYMQEKVLQEEEAAHDLEAKQSVGQLQLLVARQLIEKERESVQARPSRSERDTYVLLGQEWAFRWSVKTIDDLAGHAQNW